MDSRSSKKPFNIGPGSISSIIEELQNRNKVIKKGLALDALVAIISAYEGMDKAVINDEITTPGYYYLNRQVKGYETTQRQLGESDQDQIRECVDVLDGLAQRYRKKAVFPTVIKWAVLAPFSYIKKGENVTTDNWLPFLQPYGRTRAGKSTLGVIALAVWRKHGNSDKRDHQLGFGNIDSVARFGNAISKTTYPVLVNEVGALASDKYYYLVEMIKHSVESQSVRGKFVEGRYYTEIPALSAMILTSNYPPPVDPAYKVRVVPIHFTKEDSPTQAQKEEFKKWFFEEKRIDKLGGLGDFVVKYFLGNPDLLRNKRWEEIGKVIISEFYNAANRQAPEWINYLVEENVIEDTNDETHFELRSFFMDIITNTYSRHIKTLTANRDIVLDISFGSRLNFCLDNDLIPFLHQRNYQNKTKDAMEITITADIFSEIRKQKIQNITHMRDLATELGFDYCSRRLGGTKTKVVCGPREDFIRFLDSQIKDQEEDTKG